ncbi:glutathione peroxidase [Erwinia psidii]|uniref:glutathione peroxidase n=1 Tax=Erwinia psidii TaxID=69224 RepID=UPI00226B37AF|nr:glutathione peroxidase [Erwinia psidii]MCX8960098.1 glutathione peroxidase [Erwinia psidii]
MSIFNTELVTLDGEKTSLATWQGEVLLVVNVASKCGLTPQYEQLERLHRSLHDRGFSVLGFPCNAFLGQEPGTGEEIKHFCNTTYGVTFPMFSKTEVNGPERHPLYQRLVAAQPEAIVPEGSGFLERMVSKGRAPKEYGDILWNFEKFLVGRNGSVLARFSPDMEPENPLLTDRITEALGSDKC